MKRLATITLFSALVGVAMPHTLWAQDDAASEDAAEVSAEAAESAEADKPKEKKTLADRVKSVQRKQLIKKGRLEVYPDIALDLNDPFYQHFILGGAVAYHFADSMSAEIRAGGVLGRGDQSAIRFVREETGSLINDPPEFKWPGVFATDEAVNPSMNIGIGQRYFINDWLTARVEIRNYIFIDSRNDESDLQNLLILGFSVSGFFPMAFEYEYQ